MFLKFHKTERRTTFDNSLDVSRFDKNLNKITNTTTTTATTIASNTGNKLSTLSQQLLFKQLQQNELQQHQNPFDLYNNIKDALEFLEPTPVFPPDYSTLAQSPPRFPVYSYPNEGHESLPNYVPTIYKLDKFIRKLEWVSPYDPSPTRHWKDVILELNSTQLNIYFVENQQKNFVNHLPTLPDSDLIKNNTVDQYRSTLTSIRDLSNVIQFKKYKIMRKENLIKSYSLQHAKIGLALDYKKHKYTLRLRCETEQFLIQFPDAESMIDWNLGLCLGRDNALDLSKRTMPHYRTVPRRRHHSSRHHHHNNNSRHHHNQQQQQLGNGDQLPNARRNRERNHSDSDILHRSRNNSVSNFFHRRRAISSPTPDDLETNLRSRLSSMLRHKSSSEIINSNNMVRNKVRASSSASLLSSLNYDTVTRLSTSTEEVETVDELLQQQQQQQQKQESNVSLDPQSIQSTTSPLVVSEISTNSNESVSVDEEFYEASEDHLNNPLHFNISHHQPGQVPEIEIGAPDEVVEFDRIPDLDESDSEEDEDEDDEDSIDEEDEEEEEDVADAISTIPPLSASYGSDESGGSSGRSSSSSEEQHHQHLYSKHDEDQDSVDFKWYPEFDRLPSNKKLIKDAIRCMSTLSTTDQWCGRSIVKLYNFERMGFNHEIQLAGHGNNNSYNNSSHHLHHIHHHHHHLGGGGGNNENNGGNLKSSLGPIGGRGQMRFVREYIVTSSGLVPL